LSELESSAEAKATEERDCVFIHGPLRRGASDGYQLADVPLVSGQGLIRGHLWQAGASVALLPDPAADAPWVLGDVYRVDEDRLRILDDAHGIPAGSTSSGQVRRVRTEVFPFGSGMGMMAWIWEWIGPLDGAVAVPSGDWLNVEHPRRSPKLSLLAIGCLLLACLGAMVFQLSRYRALGDAAMTFSFTVVLLGCFANYFAGRRREHWAPLRPLLWLFFAVYFFAGLYFWALG